MKWSDRLAQIIHLVSYFIVTMLFITGIGMICAVLVGEGHANKQELEQTFGFLVHFLLFYKTPLEVNHGLMIFSVLISSFAWLFSTRIPDGTRTLRHRLFYFIYAWIPVTLIFCVYMAGLLKPITYDLLLKLDGLVQVEEHRDVLRIETLEIIGILLMIIPTIFAYNMWVKLYREYTQDHVIRDWFEEFRFNHRLLGVFGYADVGKSPDLTLAKNVETGEPVIMTGDTRQLGTGMIGPPGSGKTSVKIIVGVRQDLGHYQKAINEFPKLVKKYGLDTPEFAKAWGKQLNGIFLLEPSKDLSQQAYDLAIAHGIPEELIVYLDPSDPNTPGINSFVGPVEQVAEMFSIVLDGISETDDEFFKQSCRIVLKQYIYLMKFLKKDDCDIVMLNRMYQDPRYVADMVEELEKSLPSKEEIEKLTHDQQIYFLIAENTVRWFWNEGLQRVKDRQTGAFLKYTSGEHANKFIYEDKQFEFTRQTRNLISDMLSNPYLARVFTKPNAVNLDRLLSRGGILLCNTALGELGETMSDAFGKMVLISFQNAVFRREGTEDTRPLVSAWVDEFLNYMNKPFLALTSQARKYKTAIFVACQSLAQFDFKFGAAFTRSMIGTIRNWIVYGGVGTVDAELMSKEFGKLSIEEITVREGYTPETMDSPNRSYSETVQRTEVEAASADNIMFNKFKRSYIKMVINKSTQRAIQAEGDFVDRGEKHRKKWSSFLKEDALEAYMEYWRDFSAIKAPFDMNWIDEINGRAATAQRLEDELALEELKQYHKNKESDSDAGESRISVVEEKATVDRIGGKTSPFREVQRTETPSVPLQTKAASTAQQANKGTTSQSVGTRSPIITQPTIPNPQKVIDSQQGNTIPNQEGARQPIPISDTVANGQQGKLIAKEEERRTVPVSDTAIPYREISADRSGEQVFPVGETGTSRPIEQQIITPIVSSGKKASNLLFNIPSQQTAMELLQVPTVPVEQEPTIKVQQPTAAAQQEQEPGIQFPREQLQEEIELDTQLPVVTSQIEEQTTVQPSTPLPQHEQQPDSNVTTQSEVERVVNRRKNPQKSRSISTMEDAQLDQTNPLIKSLLGQRNNKSSRKL